MRKLRFRDEVIKLPRFTQPVSAKCCTLCPKSSVTIHYSECPPLRNFTRNTHWRLKSLLIEETEVLLDV